MLHLRSGVAFETQARFAQQLSGHREITLRVSNLVMPEVGRQVRQQALYILALAIPGDKTDCCEGMPKVMQARLATCAAQTRYASFLAQVLECSFRLLARHAIGLPSSQERSRGRSPCWPLQHYVMPKSLER